MGEPTLYSGVFVPSDEKLSPGNVVSDTVIPTYRRSTLFWSVNDDLRYSMGLTPGFPGVRDGIIPSTLD